MGELLELPLLLSQLLLEDMLVLVGMLPTLLVLSMLPSVRLSLKLMLVFSMEPMDMAMLPLLSMVTLLLVMEVLATMARDQLTLSLKLMPVCIMEDMVLDMQDLDMDIQVLDMLDMDLDTDMVLDMEVSCMVK